MAVLTGNESEVITLQEAVVMTSNYRTANAYETKALLFGKNQVMQILNQDGCVAIRAYYGITEEGAKQLVLVGVTADKEDMYNGVILDHAWPCPSCCPTSSPLAGS